MPRREIEVHAIRHLATFGRAAAESEARQDRVELDPLVEVGPGDVHAVAREHVAGALDAARTADADHREVGRAAADVGHEHEAFAIEATLVVERRGDRLELERDLAKADRLGRAAQRVRGTGVGVAGSSSTK